METLSAPLEISRGLVHFAYASQTGTAQDVAESLARNAALRGFTPRVYSLDELPLVVASDSATDPAVATVFVASTTGDGEMPDNGKAFWRSLLRRDIGPQALSSLRFTLFGLGDSGYPKFNAAARKLHTRLTQLGAIAFYDRGLGDEQSPLGLTGDLDIWAKGLWAALEAAHPLPDGSAQPSLAPRLVRTRFAVRQLPIVAGNEEAIATSPLPAGTVAGAYGRGHSATLDSTSQPEYSPPPPFGARVMCNARLTSPEWTQDVRHIELDISESGIGYYRPGDVAVVFPRNTRGGLRDGSSGESFLRRLASRLGTNLDDRIEISLRSGGRSGVDEDGAKDSPGPFSTAHHDRIASLEPMSAPAHIRGPWLCPGPDGRSVTTVRALLECALDVHGVPRRSFFEQLAFFASDEEQREKLAEMGSPEGADIYHTYCARERRSYGEVLDEFPSVSMPLAYLLELLPPLQPRSYSLASSALHSPGRAALCVAVVDFKTPWGRRKGGVASSWLASLQPGDVVPMAIKRGTFTLPTDPSVPLLLVGPGTGVAPMRSIILERAASAKQQSAARGAPLMAPNVAVVDGVGDGGDEDDGTRGISLYFGCRHRHHDWLYGNEFAGLVGGSRDTVTVIADLQPSPLPAVQQSAANSHRAEASPVTSEGPLRLYETAFSRDVPGRKLYVQGLLLRAKERVFSLLTQGGAVVFIAGSAKRMPADVIDALKDVLCDAGGASRPEADAYIAAMERGKRLVVEAWS